MRRTNHRREKHYSHRAVSRPSHIVEGNDDPLGDIEGRIEESENPLDR